MDANTVGAILDEALAAGRLALDEPTGKRVLRGVGVATPRSVVLPSLADVERFDCDLKPPFVLKVVSSEVLHKSDLGGVRLNLATARELGVAAGEMNARLAAAGKRVDGWLVEEMAGAGVEMVIGGLRDPEFGPLVMLGLGGIFVEVLGDVAFRICPITEWDARDMVDELKGGPLLKGARGQAPVNIDALVDVLLKIGGEGGLLMRAGDRVEELDLNPVIVTPLSAVAVEARFILKDGGQNAG